MSSRKSTQASGSRLGLGLTQQSLDPRSKSSRSHHSRKSSSGYGNGIPSVEASIAELELRKEKSRHPERYQKEMDRLLRYKEGQGKSQNEKDAAAKEAVERYLEVAKKFKEARYAAEDAIQISGKRASEFGYPRWDFEG